MISVNLFMAQFNLIAYCSTFSELFAEKKSVSVNELESVPFRLVFFFATNLKIKDSIVYFRFGSVPIA